MSQECPCLRSLASSMVIVDIRNHVTKAKLRGQSGLGRTSAYVVHIINAQNSPECTAYRSAICEACMSRLVFLSRSVENIRMQRM